MSLWRQRKAIERAVAGQLDPEDEARLRNHLQHCVECRSCYDALTVQARILAGDPHATPEASLRELARLMGALNPAAPSDPAPAWWPRVSIAAGVAAALVFGLISWRQTMVEPGEQIALRGNPVPASPAGLEVWVVSAAQDGGALRREISFPSDPLGRVRANEWVAFKKKTAEAGSFRVALVNAQGDTLVLKSGQSVALDVGRWRAYAIELAGPEVDDQALANAARKAGVDGTGLEALGPGLQVSGVLLVQP